MRRFSLSLVLCLLCTLSGCAIRSSDYEERVASAAVSADFKTVQVQGADQYRYVFPMPPALSAALQSPLSSGLQYQFSGGGFVVDEQGGIDAYFFAFLPERYFHGREQLKPLAERLGFTYRAEQGGRYVLPVSMRGQRFRGQDASQPALPRQYPLPPQQVTVHDGQNINIPLTLLGPASVVGGTGACVAVLPVCLAVAVPMMASGMKP